VGLCSIYGDHFCVGCPNRPTPKIYIFGVGHPWWPAPIIIGIGYIKPADTKKCPINKPTKLAQPAVKQWLHEEERAEVAQIQVKFLHVFIQFTPPPPHPVDRLCGKVNHYLFCFIFCHII
jgi:hypothetical protein